MLGHRELASRLNANPARLFLTKLVVNLATFSLVTPTFCITQL